jgi:putative DNA primase/helicase
VWGEPDERGAGLLRSWDVTPVWFERTAAFLHDLPMVLDDTKRAIRPDQVGRMLYAFANGLGRGRGSLDGTRDVGTWRSVLISSGETPATSFTEDGGTRARTLCVWGSPFGETSEVTAVAVRAYTAGVTAHYGHAGHRLLRWLLDDLAAPVRLRAAFDAHLAAWTKAAGTNGVAGRMALYVAGLATAEDVLHEVLGVPRPEGEPIAHAWEAALRGTTESDRPLDALRFVVSWAAENRESFFEARKTHDHPPARWLGAYQRSSTKNRLSILPHRLTGVLTEHGYDAEAILRAWDERGWLAREKDRREVKVVIDGQQERCVSINELGLAAANGGADA